MPVGIGVDVFVGATVVCCVGVDVFAGVCVGVRGGIEVHVAVGVETVVDIFVGVFVEIDVPVGGMTSVGCCDEVGMGAVSRMMRPSRKIGFLSFFCF